MRHGSSIAIAIWLGVFAVSVARADAIPTITGFTPQRGEPGTLIKITGTNLDAVVAVEFAGGETAEFWVPHSSMLKAIVPEGAKTGLIIVRTRVDLAYTSTAFRVAWQPSEPFYVAPPWPNPSWGAVSLRFSTAVDAAVRVQVFDASGRSVASLVNAPLPPGEHVAQWNGRSSSGARAAPGVYLIQVSTGDQYRAAKRIVLR